MKVYRREELVDPTGIGNVIPYPERAWLAPVPRVNRLRSRAMWAGGSRADKPSLSACRRREAMHRMPVMPSRVLET